MRKTLIKFDKANKNGRIYRYHEISSLPKIVPCTISHPQRFDIKINGEDTGAMAELSMDRKGIYIDKLTVYSEEIGKQFESMLIEGYELKCFGTGGYADDGTITDYRLTSIYL